MVPTWVCAPTATLHCFAFWYLEEIMMACCPELHCNALNNLLDELFLSRWRTLPTCHECTDCARPGLRRVNYCYLDDPHARQNTVDEQHVVLVDDTKATWNTSMYSSMEHALQYRGSQNWMDHVWQDPLGYRKQVKSALPHGWRMTIPACPLSLLVSQAGRAVG